MRRATFTLAIFLGLSAWAGAQGPAPVLTAAEQLRLLRANRILLTELVDRGVELGAADHPLKRAEACQRTAHALVVALGRAAEGQDADRVAELGDHLEQVMRDGLVPSLDEATGIIPAESPDAVRLKAVRDGAAFDLEAVRAATAETGAVGDSAKVKTVRDKLDDVRKKLK
jgi:hypothetical protein